MSRVKTFEPATEQLKTRKSSVSEGGGDGDVVMRDDDLGTEKKSEYFEDASVDAQWTDHRLKIFRISP